MLLESILVESKALHRQAGRQKHSNSCPIYILVESTFSLSRERETCFACIFFEPISSLLKSIIVVSIIVHRNLGRKIHSNAWPKLY